MQYKKCPVFNESSKIIKYQNSQDICSYGAKTIINKHDINSIYSISIYITNIHNLNNYTRHSKVAESTGIDNDIVYMKKHFQLYMYSTCLPIHVTVTTHGY